MYSTPTFILWRNNTQYQRKNNNNIIFQRQLNLFSINKRKYNFLHCMDSFTCMCCERRFLIKCHTYTYGFSPVRIRFMCFESKFTIKFFTTLIIYIGLLTCMDLFVFWDHQLWTTFLWLVQRWLWFIEPSWYQTMILGLKMISLINFWKLF